MLPCSNSNRRIASNFSSRTLVLRRGNCLFQALLAVAVLSFLVSVFGIISMLTSGAGDAVPALETEIKTIAANSQPFEAPGTATLELAEGGALEPLGWFLPSQGFTDEHVYLFRAEPVCVASRPEPDGSEHISDVRLVSPGELRRMIAAHEITTALTLALFARMAAKGSL